MTLPPLPDPDMLIFDPALQRNVEGLTLESARAYGAACAKAERERCAKVCESIYGPRDWIDGYTVATACATAIRALENE